LIDRMRREFKVEVNVGEPQLEYKEALTGSCSHREQYKKQTVGRGKFADIVFDISPVDEDFEGEAYNSRIKSRVVMFPKNLSHRLRTVLKQLW